MDFNTQYTDGGVQTQTPGFGAAGGGDDFGLGAYAREMMKLRLQQAQRAAAHPGGGGPHRPVDNLGVPIVQPRATQQPGAQMGALGGGGIDFKQQAQKLALREGLKNEQTMDSPAPSRMVFGAGVVPGRTLDPDSMSGRQRNVFLPNASQMTPPY